MKNIYKFFVFTVLIICTTIKVSAADIDDCYYYQSLSVQEQDVYMEIYNNISSMDMNDLYVHTDITCERVVEIFRSVINDNPDFFWIHGCVVYESSINEYRFHKIASYENSVLDFDIVNTTLNQWGKEISSKCKGKDEIESLSIITSFVVDKVDYKATYSQYNGECRNLGTIVKNGTGVCAGIAKLVQYLCNYVNIPCTYRASETHAWNAIKYQGKWYNFDITSLVSKMKNIDTNYVPTLFGEDVASRCTSYKDASTPVTIETSDVIYDFKGIVYNSNNGCTYKNGHLIDSEMTYDTINLCDGTVTITEVTGTSSNIILPEYVLIYHKLLKVTSIDQHALKKLPCKNIEVSKFVEVLDNGTIYKCKKLRSIKITGKKLLSASKKCVQKCGKTKVTFICHNVRKSVNRSLSQVKNGAIKNR